MALRHTSPIDTAHRYKPVAKCVARNRATHSLWHKAAASQQRTAQPHAIATLHQYTQASTHAGVLMVVCYHMRQSNLFSTAWGNQRNNIFLRHTERKSTAHLREHAGLHRERAVVQPPPPVPPHPELHTKRDILPLRAGGVEPCQGRPRHGAATQREHTRTTTHAALSRACARVGVYGVGERDWCDGGPGGKNLRDCQLLFWFLIKEAFTAASPVDGVVLAHTRQKK